ncbi:unnamed protein product [Brachionus calyciflorus]|uniref:Uncharacterized protein n=1 Tax=Brachionus calyciflorus TaxID=104777 RepID=A0A814QYS3_9BILA|nr:unnamed protein product [Brachionus calyciflorus]
MINKAFINNKNNQLYITTDFKNNSPTNINGQQNHLSLESSQVKKVLPKPKTTFIAIRGVHQSIDIENDDFNQYMTDNFDLDNVKRIYKKTENSKPLPLLKAKCNNARNLESILNIGLKLGYTNHRVEL